MKKIYLLAVSTLIGASAMAQVSVTFRVDMNGQTVSPDGVHVAGNWQAAAGYPGDWDPSTSELTDADTDGIYELTVTLAPGDYQYKYINGNAWGSDENQLPPIVTTGGNRIFAITQWHGTVNSDVPPTNPDGEFVLPAVQFNQAAPAGLVPVRLEIDMANETVSEQGVHVAGAFILANNNPWTPAYGTCSNVSSTRYAYVAYTTPGTYSYKFINGDNWGEPSESVGGPCSDGGTNRQIVVDASGATMPVACYGSCDPCSEPNVTFIVNLSEACTINPGGGHIAGEFNGWSGQPMTDIGSGLYSISMTLDAGTYNFKFQNGQGGWESNVTGSCAAGDGNRQVVVATPGEIVTYGPYCLGNCESDCTAPLPAADVTFRVDMGAETVSPDGVWLMGNFTVPTWQDGAVQLTDGNSDGIYEVTVNICGPAFFEYKYVNGSVSNTANEEFTGLVEQLFCLIPNGQGGWNRFYTRSGEPEVLPDVPFNECGIFSTQNLFLGDVRVFPNPSNGVSFIELENPNSHSLRMSIVDITGKMVRENMLINSNRYEIKTGNLSPGLYFLNVVNERNERAVYKLMVN